MHDTTAMILYYRMYNNVLLLYFRRCLIPQIPRQQPEIPRHQPQTKDCQWRGFIIRKSQREHILLRPDTYIGSVEPQTTVIDKLIMLVHRYNTLLPRILLSLNDGLCHRSCSPFCSYKGSDASASFAQHQSMD